MRAILASTTIALAAGTILWAHDESGQAGKDKPKADSTATPEEQLTALREAVDAAIEKAGPDFRKAYSGAKSVEEKKKLLAEYKKLLDPFAPRFLELAQKYPKESAAVQALVWVVGSVQDGAASNQAVELLLKDHLARLERFANVLVRSDAPGVARLYQGMLEKSTEKRDQAVAALTLGRYNKNMMESPFLAPKEKEQKSKEAVTYLERVVAKHADQKELVEAAKTELFEIQHLAVGKQAPDLTGVDGAGKALKLSEFRGKVVVLDFWASWCVPCMALVPHERDLVKRLEGKPFVFLGVNFDGSKEELQACEKENKMTWRSFFDGREGPIAKQWNVRSIPLIFIIDAKGIIRYKDVDGEEMDRAVEVLLKEAEKKS
jgi:thiol-disulfide isomerase/thioredoxin